ncbi:hypothetical protein BHE74_00009526 [Ensete ventricosum]|nr:hypothetical protein BHE74_00009526 [Ensete ventricosum]
MELQLDDGQRSSFSIGPGFRRCSGISPKFTRRFAEGIGKLIRNTPGDHRKKTGRLAVTIPEPIRLVGDLTRPRRLARGKIDLKISNGARVVVVAIGEVTVRTLARLGPSYKLVATPIDEVVG